MWQKRLITLVSTIILLFNMMEAPLSVAYAQQGERFRVGEYAIVIAQDSPVPLWNAPFGTTTVDVIRVGAVVEIDEIASDGTHPYLVHSRTDRTRRGWLSGELLRPVTGIRNHIGNIVTCAHSLSQRAICGTKVPLTPLDQLTFAFDYYGVEEGAYLQWMIVVDGEQYSSRPLPFLRTNGATVINLLDMDTMPHRFSGEWRVVLYINDTKVHERRMTILSENEFPQRLITQLPFPSGNPTMVLLVKGIAPTGAISLIYL